MEISTSTWMMLFFIISLVASIWKIWAFLPNKALEDDDRTEASQHELIALMIKVIKKHQGDLDSKSLFLGMRKDPSFDEKRYWRFNHNRLNQLLQEYYSEHLDVDSIEAIYNKEK